MDSNDIKALVRVIALSVAQNKEAAEDIVAWAYSDSEKEKKDEKEKTTPTFNKTISISKKKKVVKETKALSLPFSSERFLDVWGSLILQPKWKDKSATALQLSLNKLSKYDEEFAISLMEDAIERNWQGVVFSDTDEKYRQWKANRQGSRQPRDKNDVNALWDR